MNLQPLLSEYLYTTGSLSLQHAGRLKIQQEPAQLNAEATTLTAPVLAIIFQRDENEMPDDKLINFISHNLQTSVVQVQELLKQNDLAKAIEEADGNLVWPTIGTFSKLADGNISFQPENISRQYLPDISLLPVQKVVEPKTDSFFEQPEPVIEVNEPAETEALLEEPQTGAAAKSKWWIGAFIIFIVSLLLIAYRYL